MTILRRMLAALLLLVCTGGIARAQLPEAFRFTTVDGLPSNAVHQVVEDRQGYLWFATDDGLARFDGRHFRIWRREQGLVDNQLLALALDEHDRLWMGTGRGVVMRLSADRTRIDAFGGNHHPALAGAAISVLLADTQGGVWFGARGAGLFRLEPQQRLHQYLPTLRGDGVPPGDVEHLVRDTDGGLWVGTTQGLARWYDGRFHRPAVAALATAPITGMGVDADGVPWISSAVGRWRVERGTRVQAVTRHRHARLLGIGRDDAQWWADGQQVWRQPSGAGAAAPIGLASAGGGTLPRLRLAFEDRQGGAWLLGTHLGVWRLPPLWRQFRTQPAPQRQRSLDGFIPAADRSSAELSCAEDRYWRIRDGVLERRGADRRRVARWPLADTRGVPVDGPLSLHCAQDGGVWLGGAAGLKRWNGARLAAVPGAPSDITALHVDPAGGLWIAAAGVIYRYRWQRGALQQRLRLDERDGLPPLQLQAMATDGSGVLWATSATGLLRVAPARREVRLYGRDDGVPEAVLHARLQADAGTMLAIGEEGAAVAFDTAQLARPMTSPALVIERVQLRRGEHLLTVPPLGPLQLHAQDRDIQITARVLSAQLDPRQQYRFRLRDSGRGWSRTRSRGTIGFPQLAPGQHVLQYQERGGDGRWSALHELALHVQRSDWQHPGVRAARLTALLALCVVVGWGLWRSVARLRARRAAARRRGWAQQSADAKAGFLATFGHEIRTPLTGVLGMSELLLASTLAPQERRRVARIQRGGRQLLAILDDALDDARLDAGRVPLQWSRFDLLSVLQRWRQHTQLSLCGQGSIFAACVHLPGPVRVGGDPQRLRQLLEAMIDGLLGALSACRIAVQVDWLPGRGGMLLDLQAAPMAGLPMPAETVMRAALERARTCARALDGQLRVVSRSGTGWRLVLGLPLAPGTDGDDEPAPGSGVAAGEPCAPWRVLLVEDDPLLAQVHAGLLGARGAHVVTAGHALAALAEVAAAHVDVMLLDLDLPGVDGWQLLDMLRTRGCQVPVLILTARREPGLAERAAVAGAAGVLHKPVDGDQLHAAVRMLLPG